MLTPSFRFALLLPFLVAATGCSISKTVKPVAAGTTIHTIHIVKNDDTLYKQSLLDEMQAIIHEAGCQTVIVSNSQPADAEHVLQYRANWAWDLAMYLTYFQATLYEQNSIIGEVEYDARKGGGRLDKFGSTESKVRPLLQKMLAGVDHSDASSTNAPINTPDP